MDQGTAEDYALLDELAKPYVAKTGERVLSYLENIADGFPGTPSTATSTRCRRPPGRCGPESARSTSWLPCCTTSATTCRREITPSWAPRAAALRGAAHTLDGAAAWPVPRLLLFRQGGLDANARLRHRGHPAFDMTVHFCEAYDQNSFDPDYDTLSIDASCPWSRAFLRASRGGSIRTATGRSGLTGRPVRPTCPPFQPAKSSMSIPGESVVEKCRSIGVPDTLPVIGTQAF